MSSPNKGKSSLTRQESRKDISSDKKKPKEELQNVWRELVQNQRMYEMVKCLRQEKKKLKIMHSNIDGADNESFLEFATKTHAERTGRGSSDQQRRSSSTAPSSPRNTTIAKDDLEDSGKDIRRSVSSSKTQRSTSNRTILGYGRESEILMKRKSNKQLITDAEFEEIIALCEDKIEQKVLREEYEEKKARDKYLEEADEKRVMLYDFINSKFITNFMLVTIITSIIGIFLLTFETIAIRYAWPLMFLDSCIMGIFLVEAILKVYIYKDDYFKHLWNILDLTIITIHLVEVFIDLTTKTMALSTDINAFVAFKFLKSLRALRLLRVIKFLPNLQVIVETVFQSMLSMGSIAVLMLLFIFVFSVMGRGLFYERNPDRFGNLWLAFVTLFQLLTLDDWFEILETKETDTEEYQEDISEDDEEDAELMYWLMFGYLFAYLVLEFFVFLNLFVAVLVDNFQLSMGNVQLQKQREAQEELASQKKFEDLKNEGIDPTIVEEEHLLHRKEVEQLGLRVEDYFPVSRDSKEAQLLAQFFKDVNALDFQRFLWKRRQTLFHMITDIALNNRDGLNLGKEQSDSSSSAESDKDEDGDDDDDPEDRPRRSSKRRTSFFSPATKKRLSEINEDMRQMLPSRYSFGDMDDVDDISNISIKMADSKPSGNKPVESKPSGNKPVGSSKPVESKPAENKPAGSKPAEVLPQSKSNLPAAVSSVKLKEGKSTKK